VSIKTKKAEVVKCYCKGCARFIAYTLVQARVYCPKCKEWEIAKNMKKILTKTAEV